MQVDILFIDNNDSIRIGDVKDILDEITDVSVNQNTLSFDENHIPYELRLSANKKYVYLTLDLKGKNKENASVLSNAKDLIRKGKHRAGYQIVISYDESSMYFNAKLYSFISKHESKLRQLIYLILIDTFGSTWVEQTLDDKQQAELKKNLRGNKLIERGLEAFSYQEYISFLFNQRPNKFTNDFIDQTIEEIKLATEINKNKLLAFLKDNKSYSLWETASSEINYAEAEKDIKSIRDIRNGVMHNKEISIEDFDTSKKLIRKSNKGLEKAIEYVKSEHSREIRPDEVLSSLQETLANIGTQYAELVKPMHDAVSAISESISKVYRNTGLLDSIKAMQNIQQRYIDLIPKLDIPEINIPSMYFNHDLMEMDLPELSNENLEDEEIEDKNTENNTDDNESTEENNDSNDESET